MTKTRTFLFALSSSLAFGLGTPAHAAVLLFNGSASASAITGPDASCAPLPFRGIVSHANSSGSSNLGNFTYSHNACTQGGAGGAVIGTFELDFGTSLLSGAFDGYVVPRADIPGLVDQYFTYIVTGGSGIFAGATGQFNNVGTVDVRGGPPSRLSLNFDGSINAPAVPEPAMWATMMLGLSVIGAVLRRRRRTGTVLAG